MTKRRGSRGPTKDNVLRVSPKTSNDLSEYRKAQLIEDLESGHVREGNSYQPSTINSSAGDAPPMADGSYKRGAWEVSDGGVSTGSRKTGVPRQESLHAIASVAHSPEYKLSKKATDVGSSSSGFSSSSGAAVDRLAPEVYSPLFTMANLNLPRDRITVNAWCRNFFDLHPIVRNAITLHATYPISKLNLKCHDKKVLQFFEDMVEEMDLLGAIGNISLDYWKCGECFPYAELNESTGKWDQIIVQNPDYINVKKTVLSGDPLISLRPDAVLQRLVMSNNPADVQLRKKIPEKILYHVRKGQSIPLDNFNVSHLKMLSSPYDIRGTSIIVSVFKDLMLYDKVRECYSHDTEVLTERGFLKYNEVTESDKIATFNSEKNEVEYQNYTNRTEYNFKGEMYNFIGKKMDCLVTPNHKMWLSQSKSHENGYHDFNFIKAEDVKNGYFYRARGVADWKGNDDIKNVEILNKKVPIETYLEFLGHVISEGCVFQSEKKSDYKIKTSQSEKSKYFDKFQNSIKEFSACMEVNVSTQKCKNTPWEGKEENRKDTYNMFSWSINNKEIVKHIKNEIGAKAHGKKIPQWIKELSPRLLKILVKAMVEGDGTVLTPNGIRKDSTGFVYSTVSKELANDMQEVIFKCGFSPILDHTKNGQGTRYYQIRWSTSNYGRFPLIYGNRKNNKNGGGATIEKVPYDDKVFCFEVPNGLFVTRRNGKMAIQGNSKFAQADDLINPITLILVGGNTDGEYRATQEDLDYFKTMFEEATYDKNFKLVTHAGVDVKRVGSAGHVLEIASDMELIIKNIYTGLMVPQAVVDTESAVYASASIGLEVLRQRYFNFRNMMAKWLVNKIFAPISEINGFFEYKEGTRRLIVPEVEWNKMNLYDLQDYIGNLTGLVGSKQASIQTLYKSLGLNYEEEKVKMRKESIDLVIRQKEEQAMATMTLSELQTLDPEKPILDPVTDSPIEKETPPEAGAPLGGAEALPELAPGPAGPMDMGGGGGEGMMPSLGPGTPGEGGI